MQTLIQYINQLGQAGIHLLWVPLIIWTVFALIAAVFLKTAEDRISPSYQYYGRVALIWGLAAGIIGSLLFYYFPFHSPIQHGLSQAFIAIQSPVAVKVPAVSESINWASLPLWIGIITIVVLLFTVVGVAKLLANFVSLSLLSRRLPLEKTGAINEISSHNKRLLHRQKKPVQIVLSDMASVPFTFGWIQKRIVLPTYLKVNEKKMNMALHHELVHIQNHDYLIHTTIQIIRSLFFFHPLVHKFSDDIDEYREICCDRQVLQDANISKKHYAQLLFDLSPKPVLNPTTAVKMAVHPSTLKKRIQMMKNSTQPFRSLKWNLSIMLVFGLAISGLMACSDINSDSGITQADVQKTQSHISQFKIAGSPLIIVNGKKMTTDKQRDIVSRIKPKYIKSIDVLKDSTATMAYGQAGKNGVIRIKLIDKKKALNDLLDHAPDSSDWMNPHKKKIFVAVEDMPKFKDDSYTKILKNVKYPKSCKNAGIEGRVTIQFWVNKEGMPTNVHIVRGIGGGCDQAAIDAVKKYARFTPGKQHGKPVITKMALPIVFKLQDSTNTSK
jgi:TonB family protein